MADRLLEFLLLHGNETFGHAQVNVIGERHLRAKSFRETLQQFLDELRGVEADVHPLRVTPQKHGGVFLLGTDGVEAGAIRRNRGEAALDAAEDEVMSQLRNQRIRNFHIGRARQTRARFAGASGFTFTVAFASIRCKKFTPENRKRRELKILRSFRSRLVFAGYPPPSRISRRRISPRRFASRSSRIRRAELASPANRKLCGRHLTWRHAVATARPARGRFPPSRNLPSSYR